MVSNRELALMNALEVVFPSSIHLLCVFYIAKNVGAKCKEFVKVNRQDHVMKLCNKVMYLNKVFEYEQHLQYFELVCVDIPFFVDYFNQIWLLSYKEKFVATQTNQATQGKTTTTK